MNAMRDDMTRNDGMRDLADWGGMQERPLRLMDLLDHVESEHGETEIVSHWADGRETRTDWAGIAKEARRIAAALVALGLNKGDRIGTLAMNHDRHLATWYGTIGMGGVLHTVNPRLFDDQLVYILNHGGDRVLFYDAAFAPIVERLKPRLETVEHFIVFDPAEGDETRPDGYPALLAAQSGEFAWVTGDERDPCMLCYTSGTTGDPKGVLYGHRSTMIHAFAAAQPDVMNLSARSVVLPVVPMFHAAAWGLPFVAALVGAKMVFSAVNDARILTELMNRERVTHSAGVPTVWLLMFAYMDATGEAPRHLETIVVGGSAAPRPMIERLTGLAGQVRHVWGMTETSPIGTMGGPKSGWETMDEEARIRQLLRQGRVPFGVQIRTIDDEGHAQPRDGQSSGRLQVRGPWVIRRYFRKDADAVDAEGWFDTGDVARIHPCGTMEITDRAKDVIKSGGEWISSVDLENAAMTCPGIAEAAAIGIHHPKWDERPLLILVRKPGETVTDEMVRTVLSGHVAKWWLPDAIEFVDSLPHTGTGKISKKDLRDQFAEYRWPSRDPAA